jgi:nucleoside-diphosphate-sugar epimerase
MIVRPAFIGPHSRTGDSGERDFLTRLVQSLLQTKRFVRSARTLEWTPVDHIARAIIRTLADEPGAGPADQSGRGSDSLVSVRHLSSTHSRALLSYIELGVAVASVFPADDPDRPLATSPAEFVEAVRRAPDSALYPLLSVIAQPRFFGGDGEGDGDQTERDSSEEWAGRMRAVRLVAERLLAEMRPVGG